MKLVRLMNTLSGQEVYINPGEVSSIVEADSYYPTTVVHMRNGTRYVVSASASMVRSWFNGR